MGSLVSTPPVTLMAWPVMKSQKPDASITTTRATSSGSANPCLPGRHGCAVGCGIQGVDRTVDLVQEFQRLLGNGVFLGSGAQNGIEEQRGHLGLRRLSQMRQWVGGRRG